MENKGKNFSLNSNKNRPKSDFYQTPHCLTKLLLENENFEGNVLEPCSGEGAIVKVLKDYYFSKIGHFDLEIDDTDFLKYNEKWDNVITNPPYSLAQQFILHALEITNSKVAMLLPLNYLHGKERLEKIYSLKKLETVYVFNRYPMLEQELREDGKVKTGMMVYAWYVWNQNYNGDPKIKWLDINPYIAKG